MRLLITLATQKVIRRLHQILLELLLINRSAKCAIAEQNAVCHFRQHVAINPENDGRPLGGLIGGHRGCRKCRTILFFACAFNRTTPDHPTTDVHPCQNHVCLVVVDLPCPLKQNVCACLAGTHAWFYTGIFRDVRRWSYIVVIKYHSIRSYYRGKV